jgi:hypothetical protein
VVVRDFDIVCIAVFPRKTDSVLIVNPDGVLPAPVTVETFQVVPGRHSQILEITYSVQLVQLPTGNRPHGAGAGSACRWAVQAVEDGFSAPILE